MTLYVVATPIGAVEDLSPRAREILGRVTLIASEDTRTTMRLLKAVAITPPKIVALHGYNEMSVAQGVAERALTQDVALVSEAGTPAISDPGRVLVQLALELGVDVRSLPGPSALSAALAASGFPAAPATFLGFAPRKGRDGWLDAQLSRGDTLVIYESPRRFKDLIQRLAQLEPEREVAMVREISKTYEEVLRAPVAQLCDILSARDVKGECVLVVGPSDVRAPRRQAAEVTGGDAKKIAAQIAARCGVNKRDAYQALLKLEESLKESQ